MDRTIRTLQSALLGFGMLCFAAGPSSAAGFATHELGSTCEPTIQSPTEGAQRLASSEDAGFFRWTGCGKEISHYEVELVSPSGKARVETAYTSSWSSPSTAFPEIESQESGVSAVGQPELGWYRFSVRGCRDKCSSSDRWSRVYYRLGSGNKFGVGYVNEGSASMAGHARDLAGPDGWVLTVCPQLRRGVTSAPSCRTSVEQLVSAGAKNILVRLGPPWGDRRIRNDSDTGSRLSYDALGQDYKAVVQQLLGALPDNTFTLAVQIGNEQNLCYEWEGDEGVHLTEPTIAAEVAAFHRDIGDALQQVSDPRLVVVSTPMAPGGAVECMVTNRDGNCWNPWESCGNSTCDGGGTARGCFRPGSTSTQFIDFMRAYDSNVFGGGRFDGFGSHPYPAQGFGWGFYVPFDQASVGLHVYEQELQHAGVQLPVYVTETGWPDFGPRGDTSKDDYTWEQIGDMLVSAWTSTQSGNLGWLADSKVAAVMPFCLAQGGEWGPFSWLDDAGSRRAQYQRVRDERCARFPSGDCPGGPVDHAEIEEGASSVPSQMAPGSVEPVTLRVRNAGSSTWTAAQAYQLGTATGNQAGWSGFQCGGEAGGPGGSRANLCSDVAPGQSVDFLFDITAPSSGTSFTLAARMGRDGSGFGESESWSIQLDSPPPPGENGARFALEQSDIPLGILWDHPSTITVRVENTGTTTWTAGQKHRLGVCSNNTFELSNFACNGYFLELDDARVFLCDDVAPGEMAEFTFDVVNGTPFDWQAPLCLQMVQDHVEWFGEPQEVFLRIAME